MSRRVKGIAGLIFFWCTGAAMMIGFAMADPPKTQIKDPQSPAPQICFDLPF